MAGGFVGAASIARAQIELWTLDLARRQNIKAEDDAATYMKKCWAPYGASPFPAWSLLSEIIHGREPGLSAIEWDSEFLLECDLTKNPPDRGTVAGINVISTVSFAMDLVLLHVWSLVRSVAAEQSCAEVSSLETLVRWCAPALSNFRQLWVPALWQLDLDTLEHGAINTIKEVGASYQSRLASSPWPVSNQGELACLSLLSRRARAIETSERTFAAERRTLGPEFSPLRLHGKDVTKILVCEMAGLVSRWTATSGAKSLAIAASAMRSAYLFWLEDDPKSMACLRTVLESLARARAWRLKPHKAEKLDAAPDATTPRDWVNEAGWRRLAVLLKSLGDFSHVSERTNRTLEDAYRDLTRLQEWRPAPSSGVQTARGHTLEMLVYVMALEVVEWLALRSQPLAHAFETLLPFADKAELEQRVERWLNHAWQVRKEKADVGSAASST